MKQGKNLIVVILFIFCLLFSEGCSRTVEQPAGSGEQRDLTITAVFEQENGTPLSERTIRFSDGENSVDCHSDQDGSLTISGLPSEGELSVAVLDGQGASQGTLTLSFSRGAVIDAVTDEDCVGHITLKEDTREITLNFTLRDSGSLECQLRLSEARIV